MDPITHAALGASCTQAIFGKYNKHIPWQVGALAAMTPDLDIFMQFKNNPLSTELWHRNFTHSFLFIPIGALLVALFFLCFSRYRRSWKVIIGAAFVGYATHGLLDALTSYGTVLLWPVNDTRFSWDIIAIIDPIFTLPLILGTVWSVINQEQKGAIIGLLCASVILLFNSIQHHRALQRVYAFATQQKLHVTNIRALPELASSVYWRGIAKSQHCLIITEVHTPILKESSIMPVAQIPLFFHPSTLSFTPGQQKDLVIFSWFTDDYIIVANQTPLMLADGRYTLGNNPLYSLWGIKFSPKKDHVNKLHFPLLHDHCIA